MELSEKKCFAACDGSGLVCLLALLRRVSPLACDGWRGPLSHLLCPPGRVFNPPHCPICIQELVVGEDLCRTPCGHDFHRDCLEDWVLSRRYTSAGCPLCRESLLMSESSDPSRLFLADCAQTSATQRGGSFDWRPSELLTV
eukprot:s894_g9.t1